MRQPHLVASRFHSGGDLIGLYGGDCVEEVGIGISVRWLDKSRRGRADRPAQFCHRKPVKQENELET